MALECTAEQMIEMLDEHLPYEVAMMLACHDNLYPAGHVMPAPPQPQACSPSKGRSSCASQTQ
jgi:hypothetical protein